MRGDRPLTDAELRRADQVLSRQPRNRVECPPADVPCPFVACRYHVWTSTTLRQGVVVDVQVGRGWGDVKHTCALVLAEQGPRTMDQVGKILGVSRERVRQLEAGAIQFLRRERPGALHDLSGSDDHVHDLTGAQPVRQDASVSTADQPEWRRKSWHRYNQARRQRLCEAEQSSPLVPCPRGCGRLVHEITRSGRKTKACPRCRRKAGGGSV